jgi:hypothetical protein
MVSFDRGPHVDSTGHAGTMNNSERKQKNCFFSFSTKSRHLCLSVWSNKTVNFPAESQISHQPLCYNHRLVCTYQIPARLKPFRAKIANPLVGSSWKNLTVTKFFYTTSFSRFNPLSTQNHHLHHRRILGVPICLPRLHFLHDF